MFVATNMLNLQVRRCADDHVRSASARRHTVPDARSHVNSVWHSNVHDQKALRSQSYGARSTGL